MVRLGMYEDPHGLYLHRELEHNTLYFPKLCLDETPTVDMASHDLNRADGTDNPTPLNDDKLFAWEHLKAKQAFENFCWTRDEVDPDDDHEHGSDFGDDHGESRDRRSMATYRSYGTEHEDRDHRYEYDADHLAPEIDGEPLTWSVSEHTEQTHDYAGEMGTDTELESIGDDVSRSTEHQPPGIATRTPAVQPSTTSMRAASLSSPVSPASRPLPPSPILSSITAPPSPSPRIEQDAGLPSLSPVASLSRSPVPASSPKAIGLPSPRNKRNLHLPSGLPSTGLSSSDIVSVPSPDMASPTRLIRRHTAGKPSIDTTATSRLSVDLGGTLSRLGDDDWEQLETSASAIPSVPNAAPSAFFTRRFGTVLRRRPSATLGQSGLRRQTKNSDSSRESSSPTKRRQLLSVKSIENTKKAFKKAFPRLKRDSRPKDPPVSADALPRARDHRMASPTPSTPSATPSRPNLGRRSNTETASVSAPNTAHPSAGTSWFSTRRIGRSNKTSKAYSSSSSDSGTNLAVSTGQLSLGPGGVPRVELNHTAPVVWELDKGKTSPPPRPTTGAVHGSVDPSSPVDRSRAGALAPRPENKEHPEVKDLPSKSA